jgi:hypothetical protein
MLSFAQNFCGGVTSFNNTVALKSKYLGFLYCLNLVKINSNM